MLAGAARAGIDPRWLARLTIDGDDWHVWQAVAAESIDQQRQHDEAQAQRIGEAVADRIADMLPWVRKRKKG